MIKAEPFELHSIVTGTVRLDGGAMFGVVPKTMWSTKTDVDDRNRILLFTRTLLAIDRNNKRVVLVDTGAGSKWSAKLADRYGVSFNDNAIDDALTKLGLSPDDVTDVVATHLHFDHNGGMTEWVDDENGPTRPRFSKANHWVHRKQWEHAHNPTRKDKASFIAHDFDVLAEAGLLRLVEGDQPDSPIEGLSWRLSSGHTPYQLLPVFGEGEGRVLFVGDLIPTMNHLSPAWVMAYDLYPTTTLDEKEEVLRLCIEDGMRLAFPHDPQAGAVAIGGTVDKPVVTEQLL